MSIILTLEERGTILIQKRANNIKTIFVFYDDSLQDIRDSFHPVAYRCLGATPDGMGIVLRF